MEDPSPGHAVPVFHGEKPVNGLLGLKHWRQDLTAGLMVSLVSLPFSLGIAVASGAPPVAGLISAIIAGLIYPFLGGSFVTISGPAAGLAPALLAGMTVLGSGNLEVGYPLLLCVIAMTGTVQIILSLLKAARYSALFPLAVVQGMLTSIGLLIIAKQLPLLLGTKFEAHEFFEILWEVPTAVLHLQPQVFGLGLFCLALCFLLEALKTRGVRLLVPPPLIVVLVGIGFGWVLGIGEAFCIHIPANILEHGIVLPDFGTLLGNQHLWWAALTIVLTLTLIDGVESLATIAAIDRIDPYQRKSNPNRTLLAMGISNICSSLAGGLTIIPGGVKSTVCIMTGGRTLWANFYNAVFLLLFLFFGTALINLIPLSALAAVVAFIGYKLCAPRVWRRVAHIGSEQLLVFTITVLTTLATDLLIGIFVGMAAKLVLSAVFTWVGRHGDEQPRLRIGTVLRHVASLFRSPVVNCETRDGIYHLYFDGPLVCFNALAINEALASIPSDVKGVQLHVLENVPLIDHTTCDNLLKFVNEFKARGLGEIEITGLGRLFMRSGHESCMRVHAPLLCTQLLGYLGSVPRRLVRSLLPVPVSLERAEEENVQLSLEAAEPYDAKEEMDWLSLSHADGEPAAVGTGPDSDLSLRAMLDGTEEANGELDAAPWEKRGGYLDPVAPKANSGS